MIYLIGIATVLSTLLGGLFALRFKDKLHLILGFSAGAVMGVAFFDLIPESIELATKQHDISLVTIFFALGFVTYLVFDRWFSLHPHDSEDCHKPRHQGRLAVVSLVCHSLLDGLGIGLAFKVSPAVGWIVAAAVLTHDFSDGINTIGLVLKSHGSKRQAIKWLMADALAPAVGITIAWFMTVPEATLGLLLALFTGLFLYLGASDLVPESHHQHPSRWTTLMTLAGIIVLFAATRLAAS
jgi:ZIP family zinc transporter